ncbi:MAG TPA: bifunctional UDP-N-acetylglucosamine diphosphorylase/glucosamine-1-phosphate N-acetyltransferase GlmU [Candidatus Agathobaculum merdipullorum]|nr:bifunctional UDP-N-acetylglucosamine diphosphorylase/glucosamine-1-phosphate N-acetyltransferase GlmU [Candidatus Agathobaculum merdipullorum]
MDKITAALVGGLFDEGGFSAFARPVLFGTAGDTVRDELPETVDACYFVHDDREPALAGAESIALEQGNRFAALRTLPESEQVLVIAAPFVLPEDDALTHLTETHVTTGYGVSVLVAEQQGFDAEGQPIPRDAHCLAAMFTYEMLQKALAAGGDTLDALVEAAVAAGAQKGVAVTNEIVEICDGGSAYIAFRAMVNRVNFTLIDKGVQIFDPANTYIAPDAEIEAGVTILPGCHIRPGCKVGAGAVIGPNSILEKAEIGAGTTVNNSQVYESKIGAHTTVGPFAYVRPQCVVGDGCRIGDFVELKKSTIGNGTKVSHLTYIGDATVGERVNFGCGTVVVNYDGYHKYQTVIGDDCFIGCNTNLVSPVTLGDRVFTAAGATITKDVPAGALAVARARQTTLEGWNDRRREMHEKEQNKK